MTETYADPSILLERAIAGDETALAMLFDTHRDRLGRMIRVRLDRRLRGRIDESDIVQETYLELKTRFAEFARDQSFPFALWLRLLAGQRLLALHRRHLKAKMRDAGREISLAKGAYPEASSVSLAGQLLGSLTSASKAAIRAEHRLIVRNAIDSLDAMDREVLTLRHFEHLTNDETALLLGLSKAAASNRYIRALKRLKAALASIPGLDQVP
jgi:RNA polymerase sigma-70 factor (ECF subfamily)